MIFVVSVGRAGGWAARVASLLACLPACLAHSLHARRSNTRHSNTRHSNVRPSKASHNLQLCVRFVLHVLLLGIRKLNLGMQMTCVVLHTSSTFKIVACDAQHEFPILLMATFTPF